MTAPGTALLEVLILGAHAILDGLAESAAIIGLRLFI